MELHIAIGLLKDHNKSLAPGNDLSTAIETVLAHLQSCNSFTLPEVDTLLRVKVGRYKNSLLPGHNDAFSMGERNIAEIVSSFLTHEGTVKMYGEMPSVEGAY